MATYTNLASLASCQVGDVITYTAETQIDFSGKNVKIELFGYSPSASYSGGYTKFNYN